MYISHHQSHTSAGLINRLTQTHSFNELPSDTAKNYISWILRFLHFHNHAQPQTLKQTDLELFLSDLGSQKSCNGHVQQQAYKAISFFYKHLFNKSFDNIEYSYQPIRRGFCSRFSQHHCLSVVQKLSGAPRLIAQIAVTLNLKLREVINLRLGDIDFKKNTLIIRKINGQKFYQTSIPIMLILDLRIQSMKTRHLVMKEKQSIIDNESFSLNIPLAIEEQFLFTDTYNQCQHTQYAKLQQIPIMRIKNDILLAIKEYLRFLPDPPKPSSNSRPKSYQLKKAGSFQQGASAKPSSNHTTYQQQTSFRFNQQINAM